MSQLDHLIPPEIRRDGLAQAIQRVAATAGVRTILEIGASSGEGSTAAFVAGAMRNPERPAIHCLEVSRARYEALVQRYREYGFVHCHHMSSVALERFPSPAEVERFHRTVRVTLRRPSLETLLRWLQQDVEYVTKHGLSVDGIRLLKSRLGVEQFDAVLIDGSEFTGAAELQDVYGARFLLLDDILTFKNHANYQRLLADPGYHLVKRSRWRRNGYAVFERRETA